MPPSSQIVATGAFLPEVEITNDDLRARFDAAFPGFVDEMEASTGIQRRFHAPDAMVTSDLATAAAREALGRAGLAPGDVDLILLGTDTPDYVTPATSVVVQHKLGATKAGTFDIGCACASFPVGLTTAAGWIATNPAIRHVLVIGAYLMHRHAADDDPTTFFYGDGASAAVVSAGSEPGFVAASTRADGSYHAHWGIYSGGTAEPASEESVREGRTKVRLLERYPPDVNHDGWPAIVRELATRGGFAVSDIDLAIFTQVRKPSIELVMADLGLPLERTHTIMEDHGYTGSACVGMALDAAVLAGNVRAGDLVVLVGSGVGYNQAGCAFRIGDALPGAPA